jgi:SAM-dependent methyltransferase
MKVCLTCERRFEARDWSCPACGYEPAMAGFRLFAPDLADSNVGFEVDAFERLARQEPTSFWFRSRNRLVVELVRRHFSQARSLLEIGCGTGFVLAGIHEAMPDVRLVGSDLHPAGLAFAAQRVPGAELYQMDARRIPFDSEFDVVIALDVLEHIEQDDRVLAELLKALRPGGVAIIAVPQHPWLWNAGDDFSHHKRRYRRPDLQAKLRHAGFELLQTTSFVSLLLPFMALSRAAQRGRRAYDPSREFQIPRPLDRGFEVLLETDRWLIRRGFSLPAGGSLVAVARKPLSVDLTKARSNPTLTGRSEQ